MNITEIPRALIYKDIDNIKDIIGSNSEKTLESVFFEKLVERPFIKGSKNPPKYVNIVFNNARYIYYLLNIEDNDTYNPILCFNIYLAKASEGTDETGLKDHVAAATMALFYNLLENNLHNNRSCIPELQRDNYVYFSEIQETEIIKLKEGIYTYFSNGVKNVMPEIKEDFIELLIDDYNLQANTDIDYFDVPDIKDFSKGWLFSVQDIAEGIDYIIEGLDIPFDKNRERIGFLDEILNRFDKEMLSVTNNDAIDLAKHKIDCEKQRLLSTPESEPLSRGLSIDNLHAVPDSWDGNIDTHISGVDSSVGLPEELQSEKAQTLLEKAKEEGWLDKNLQPTLSSTESAVLAVHLADLLDFREVWKVFGALWHKNTETMRAKYNLALKQNKTLEFQDKLKKVLK
jgi:hypothetical protein